MNYQLPISFMDENGEHPIRSNGDWRVILDVIAVLNDPELSPEDIGACALFIFFEDVDNIANAKGACKFLVDFINGGETDGDVPSQHCKLMDWEQDLKIIIAPVNRILGTEIRALPYLHWWSFLSAYYEIGECTFSTVVSIRKKLQSGKKLEKYETDLLRDNPSIVKLKKRQSESDKRFLDSFLDE